MRDELDPGEWENDGGGGPGCRVPPTISCMSSTDSTPSQPFPLHIFPGVPNPDRTYLWYALLHQRLREGCPVDALGGAAHARSE